MVPSPVILTNEQQEELTAVLAELLLLNVMKPAAVQKGVHDADKISPDHLRRVAVVYIRQSSITQLTHNLESQRRQYGLVNHAKGLGFDNVEIIDDDLGRSGSGLVPAARLSTTRCDGL